MSHKPNWEEYGMPCVSSGGQKTVTEIHDSIYGKYDHTYHEPPNGGANPATKLDPKPFNMK